MRNDDLNKGSCLTTCDEKKCVEEKLNRRQFLKATAAVGAAGTVLASSLISGCKEKLTDEIKKISRKKGMENFPMVLTEKCKPMDQKNTIFCRELWDHDFVKRIESEAAASRVPLSQREKGWRQLDRALNAAGWALDHKFATGSENGQPMSPAYDWNGPVADRKYQFKNPEDAAKKIKKAARFLGASLVGISSYNLLWTYSRLVKENLENDPDEHEEVKFDLIKPEFPFTPKSVVVIAVEMDYNAIALSPSSLEGAATGLGYSQMCAVGYSVATFIRQLGYRAFANGNDISLSIPYGVEAGLGELGRNGLLITPEFGPRVRLVKVFTELDIKPDRFETFGAWEFCKSCKRCAESCPSGAIPFGKPTMEGTTISNNPGVLKWYINPEKCIQFWIENGSDCANCITACPFNKPAMWHHHLMAAVSRFPGAPLHTLMAKMDKLFGYGNTFDMKANAAFWEEN